MGSQGDMLMARKLMKQHGNENWQPPVAHAGGILHTNADRSTAHAPQRSTAAIHFDEPPESRGTTPKPPGTANGNVGHRVFKGTRDFYSRPDLDAMVEEVVRQSVQKQREAEEHRRQVIQYHRQETREKLRMRKAHRLEVEASAGILTSAAQFDEYGVSVSPPRQRLPSPAKLLPVVPDNERLRLLLHRDLRRQKLSDVRMRRQNLEASIGTPYVTRTGFSPNLSAASSDPQNNTFPGSHKMAASRDRVAFLHEFASSLGNRARTLPPLHAPMLRKASFARASEGSQTADSPSATVAALAAASQQILSLGPSGGGADLPLPNPSRGEENEGEFGDEASLDALNVQAVADLSAKFELHVAVCRSERLGGTRRKENLLLSLDPKALRAEALSTPVYN